MLRSRERGERREGERAKERVRGKERERERGRAERETVEGIIVSID